MIEKLNKIGCRQLAEFINQHTEFVLFRMKKNEMQNEMKKIIMQAH